MRKYQAEAVVVVNRGLGHSLRTKTFPDKNGVRAPRGGHFNRRNTHDTGGEINNNCSFTNENSTTTTTTTTIILRLFAFIRSRVNQHVYPIPSIPALFVFDRTHVEAYFPFLPREVGAAPTTGRGWRQEPREIARKSKAAPRFVNKLRRNIRWEP